MPRQVQRHVAAHAIAEDVGAFQRAPCQVSADVFGKVLNPKRALTRRRTPVPFKIQPVELIAIFQQRLQRLKLWTGAHCAMQEQQVRF